jgi:hypothetical protein
MVESFGRFATGALHGALTSVVPVESTFSLALFGGLLKECGILYEDEMHHGLDAIQRPATDSRLV